VHFSVSSAERRCVLLLLYIIQKPLVISVVVVTFAGSVELSMTICTTYCRRVAFQGAAAHTVQFLRVWVFVGYV
jgi:hypothetical protein